MATFSEIVRKRCESAKSKDVTGKTDKSAIYSFTQFEKPSWGEITPKAIYRGEKMTLRINVAVVFIRSHNILKLSIRKKTRIPIKTSDPTGSITAKKIPTKEGITSRLPIPDPSVIRPNTRLRSMKTKSKIKYPQIPVPKIPFVRRSNIFSPGPRGMISLRNKLRMPMLTYIKSTSSPDIAYEKVTKTSAIANFGRADWMEITVRGFSWTRNIIIKARMMVMITKSA